MKKAIRNYFKRQETKRLLKANQRRKERRLAGYITPFEAQQGKSYLEKALDTITGN